MSVQLKNIIQHLSQLAPNDLSYQWDNTGLIIGSYDQMIHNVMITLDITENVIDKAIDNHIDLIIAHHPLIFKPIKKITDKRIIRLIQNKIAVFVAHTNLDVVKNGVNHALANKLGLKIINFLQPNIEKELLQISVYTPMDDLEKLKEALFRCNAGVIGNYSQCENHFSVNGQFKPMDDANPFLGNKNQLQQVQEIKLEFLVDSIYLSDCINAIKLCHSYETPVYTVIPLKQNSQNFGLGLWAELNNEMTLEHFALHVKKSLQAPFVKLWTAGKPMNDPVKKIALCGGSGSSLLPLISNADVFLSADFTYHHLLDSKIPIIDAGHFYTEQPVVDFLKSYLSDFEINIETIAINDHNIQNLFLI